MTIPNVLKLHTLLIISVVHELFINNPFMTGKNWFRYGGIFGANTDCRLCHW